jgi:UDP-3-O-[3-hydroxymyristoyl] N-acetylglucosamine deacetylase
MLPQQTLKTAIHCTGVGVHGNRKVRMELRPGAPGTGIVFCRSDRPAGSARTIEAVYENVVDARLCTTIGNGTVSVRTVEHLMAAFAGCGIDNAVVELDGEEVPAMDGSAAPFVFLIECAGVVEQCAPRRMIEVLKPIRLGDENRYIGITPAERFSIRCEIDFDHPALGYQSVIFDPLRTCFRTELARARTFCRESDVASILAAGMGQGGSLENTVVIGDDGPLNEDGLRYADECARHKALDCFGDLYLAGAPIIGHVRCLRSGHGMNHALLSALLEDPDAWRFTGAEHDTVFGEPDREPVAAIA